MSDQGKDKTKMFWSKMVKRHQKLPVPYRVSFSLVIHILQASGKEINKINGVPMMKSSFIR